MVRYRTFQLGVGRLARATRRLQRLHNGRELLVALLHPSLLVVELALENAHVGLGLVHLLVERVVLLLELPP